jgi:site-specific recombinase XerD
MHLKSKLEVVKNRSPSPKPEEAAKARTDQAGFPDGAALSALRAWYEGLGAREAVVRYLGNKKADGQSSRAMLGRTRRHLADYAERRHRNDLAALFTHPAAERAVRARAVAHAIEQLRGAPAPEPQITDDLALWLAPRAVDALKACGMCTLADLTVRIPRRRRWWTAVAGLGQTGARSVELFFADHPQLTERARKLVARDAPTDVVPWERVHVPAELDGSNGAFRAPRATCALRSSNDYEAVQTWLELHESAATRRAYRKEAERLILWAIVERRVPLSSLATEDAIAYRAFLRHPSPRGRWVGPPRPRSSIEWRPFAGDLSAKSVAYSISVLGAMFRWLIEQRYLLVNPFAGVKVRGTSGSVPLDASKAFTEGEWALVLAVSESLEWSHGWSIAAAQRLRFGLTFAYACGLRAGELVAATLGQFKSDDRGEHWLHLTGKGGKAAKVALPPMAIGALDTYLTQRALPTTRSRWNAATPILASLDENRRGGISASRLWRIVHRFFMLAADVIEADAPAAAEKLRSASPHWMRHTHATHALARGTELTTVRDNLRHASISTTSIYLHADDLKRAKQIAKAFA